jgi:hypothetical protein
VNGGGGRADHERRRCVKRWRRRRHLAWADDSCLPHWRRRGGRAVCRTTPAIVRGDAINVRRRMRGGGSGGNSRRVATCGRSSQRVRANKNALRRVSGDGWKRARGCGIKAATVSSGNAGTGVGDDGFFVSSCAAMPRMATRDGSVAGRQATALRVAGGAATHRTSGMRLALRGQRNSATPASS